MEIRQLEHFLAVAEHRNFTRAAERLHTVQSAVSASVKTLEQELRVALFARNSRSVSLTAEGAALIPAARKVLAALDEAEDVAASFHGAVRGSVAVGMLLARDVVDIPGALAEFHARHPGVTISARTSPTGGAGLIEGVLDESLDLSLVVLPLPPNPNVVTEPLRSGGLSIAAAEGHPLADGRVKAPAELDGSDFVMLPRGFSTRRVFEEWLIGHGIEPRVSVEVGDQAVVAEYVRAGLGLGVLADHEIEATDGVTALRVPEFRGRWEAAIATKRGRHHSAAATAMIELLRARAVAWTGATPA
jgi:DNA-binding transcriptional LysR family regulator